MDGEPYSGAVGIDLGTTYSCVGVWKNNRVETILNDQGNRITPSYVAFTKREKLVGDVAKNQAIANYRNSLFDSKRLIGRTYQDERVQYDKKQWPFEILERNEKIVYKVQFKDETIYVTPEEVAAEILIYLKKMTEKHLGKPVKDVVISVPAYFNNHQRQSTINSATMAGLNVHAVLNEPTAAAIAYGMENMSLVKRKVLVFDLGGGTFDVSLLNIQGEHFEVLATAGDTHLGGNDFDIRLVNYFIEEFNNQTGLDIAENSTALGRLRSYAEKAKRVLSTAEFATIDIDCLFENKDFHSPISRRKFEELCEDLFDSTIELLDNALDDVSVQKNEIDEIVMIGGSTRICKIQELVSIYFDGRTLQNGVNPEEAVAHGATIHATKFTKSLLDSMKDLTLADITPLSLGIEMKDQAMATIIRRNTTIPVTKQRTFTTTEDYQTEVRIEIYEGESTNSKLNTRLGLFRLNGIPSALRGIPKVDVTFTIDANGVLKVTACNRETGSTNQLDIVYERDIRL